MPGLASNSFACVVSCPRPTSSATSNRAVGATSVSERRICHEARRTATASAAKTPAQVRWVLERAVSTFRGMNRPSHLSPWGSRRLKRWRQRCSVECQAGISERVRLSVNKTMASRSLVGGTTYHSQPTAPEAALFCIYVIKGIRNGVDRDDLQAMGAC